MLSKKKIILLVIFFVFICLAFFIVPAIYDYIKYQSVVKAAGGGSCPMLEGARATKVMPCIRDTPVIAPVRCLTSCPLLDVALTTLCSSQIIEATTCISTAQDPVVACGNQIREAIECQGCELYYEVTLSEAQNGNLFYGIPKLFTNYKGGGTSIMTQAGNQNIWCGNSNIDPIVVGIPSASASRIQRLVKWFDKYIIAGFSKK